MDEIFELVEMVNLNQYTIAAKCMSMEKALSKVLKSL